MANRYWRGGTGTWDTDTSHWSTTSGGAGGASVPGVSDVAIFNSSSGGGTCTLGQAVSVLDIILDAVTLTTADYDITLGRRLVFGYTTSATLNLGSSLVIITENGTAAWDTANAGSTLNAGTSTIKIVNNISEDVNFNGGSRTYHNVWFTGSSANQINIKGSNTFNDFKIDTPPKTVEFAEGTTQTVSSFTVTGTAGNLITLQSSQPTPLGTIGFEEGVDWSIGNAGTNYEIGDEIYISGGNSDAVFTVDDVGGSGEVTVLSSTSGGSGYSIANGVATTTSGAGSNFTLNILQVSTTVFTFTLSKSSGTVNCDYLSISNSIATGGAIWYAGYHSTNSGNNIGWKFGQGPTQASFLTRFLS
jgi:hypothetical protein